MKALKTTLILAMLIATLTSCTKQELNEDEVLQSTNTSSAPITGGQYKD